MQALPITIESWNLGDPTQHPPIDATFLTHLRAAGFENYTGPSGLIGARAAGRAVQVVHRGCGKTWEVYFRDKDRDHVKTLTNNMPGIRDAAKAWLAGESLTVENVA